MAWDTSIKVEEGTCTSYQNITIVIPPVSFRLITDILLPDAFSLNSHTGKEKLYGYNLLKFRKNYVTQNRGIPFLLKDIILRFITSPSFDVQVLL